MSLEKTSEYLTSLDRRRDAERANAEAAQNILRACKQYCRLVRIAADKGSAAIDLGKLERVLARFGASEDEFIRDVEAAYQSLHATAPAAPAVQDAEVGEAPVSWDSVLENEGG